MTTTSPGRESRAMWHTSQRHLGVCLLSIFALLVVTVAPKAAQQHRSPLPPDTGTRVRRSVAVLTAAERQDFVDAVLALKRARSPYDSAALGYRHA